MLTVFHNRRWDGGYLTVKRVIGEGVLGSVHTIDQALLLFGMPDWQQADVYTQRPGAGVDDAFQ